MVDSRPDIRYSDLAGLFLRMSVVAFGGPVAHIAMGEDEIVRRRGWMTREQYLDIIAASNLIPGPNSTEVMIHVGHRAKGIPGAVFAGLCFITPAFLITLALALLYVRYGALPQVEALLWGIQPVMIAIIVLAAWRLLPTALHSRGLLAVFAAALALLALSDLPDVVVMLGAGLIYALMRAAPRAAAALALLPAGLPALQAAAPAAAPGLLSVFWEFLKIGSVLFGSGYVLVTYLEVDIVERLGWITRTQLLDSIAIGQFTPGPVLTTATVVGTIIGGVPLALAATVGIFLPAFVLVIVTAPLLPRLRSSVFWSAFLDGVNAAVVAAILVTVAHLASSAFAALPGDPLPVGGLSPIALALACVTGLGMLRFRINATLFIVLGAGVGALIGVLAPA
jgi:chromate transporter